MKQVENRWVACLVLLMVVHITMEEQVASKPMDRNSTLLHYYCSAYRRLNEKYFWSNLNITLSSIRSQLATSGQGTSHTLRNGESVWASSGCRGYLAIPDCLDCFDYGVDQLKRCGIGIGAQVGYSDCDLRYENYNFFSGTSIYETGLKLCDNITASQPKEFRKETEKLLSDLATAASRATNFYAASTRKIAVDNTTVYAFAQCNLNISENGCLECLKLRSRSLYDCLPTTSAQAAFGPTLNNGCFMRYARTPFFGQNQTTDIASLLWDANSRKKRYIIGIVVGGVSFLLLALAIFSTCGKRKRTYRGHQGPRLLKATVYYNHKHLELATNNFSEENVIGKGGFGEVYKATLDDDKVVAVKKLKVGYAGAQVGFENEILLISQIHHRNLLGLLGWSIEGSNLLLVLEHMPNGSLDKFLWGEKKGALSWKTRHDIILGIARGLAHLHKEFHVRIVHRDIKSSNILLDEDFQPKVADFGLARFQPEDQSHITTMFAGTLGYTAPEYVLYGHLSDKVDTFSFGIVILEIVSGRKCTYRNFDASSNDCLLEYAWKMYETKNFMKLVDETMYLNQCEEEQMTSIIKIALLCTQSPVSKRPTMSEVVLMLQNDPSLGERQLTKPNFIDHDWRIQIGTS
ncbi:cysteine-rich receptor-like protein kinase 2 isoform X2 [Bidens hawaiensis]|uniref:cysteine-rich receptor-like protein kinase 2 isoform X2 n=1 Tax=Bidens hawaiensis TaxID=980011 RepID=UPI00404AA48C